MTGSSTEEYDAGSGSSPAEGMPACQRRQAIESLAEWRSSEQVENGTASSSPPFWDTDDDDDDCGPKPSELYGRFTWKIENLRQINKRELRSNAFEVGGYKWYILIYPQGCDVCNHLSLFLCVANHDKLLPGWSHFAQFTIAVINKDPKKSKFSDTLHRFWKKEHDWGWKKFMENSKVYESFVNDDTLVIKAQVQVIREKANRPFRCLDCQYRRELVRVYISNVEQICRRFIEDRKNKLSKLIEDEMRWSSFRSFWTGVDQNSRRRMSRDKLDTILRIVVKQFFVEKEVTSTLVMDSLHSGLKALEHHSKNMKGRLKLETEESHDPMVRVDKDMFILGDDVVLLLDRVASEPLPTTSLPPKDDKALLNRAKEGSCCEEFNKDSLERDERRLTELGQRTMEICVIAHIFSSKIEVAHQDAVALKRQEELIREEEATGQAEHELNVKRAAADIEKRAKKKQAKQKRNSRRSKYQLSDVKSALALKESQRDKSVGEIVFTELPSNPEQFISEKVDIPEDASDVSYAGEEVAEILHPDLDDKDSSPVNWDTDASEAHPCMGTRASDYSYEQPEKRNPIIDDSSSTCSTDSVPSVVSNGPYKGFFGVNNRSQASPNQVKNQLSKDLLSQESIAGHFGDSPRSDSSCLEMVADAAHLIHSKLWPEKHVIDKRGTAATVQKKIIPKDQADTNRLAAPPSIPKVSSSSVRSGRKAQTLVHQLKKSLEVSTMPSSTTAASATEPAPIKSPPAVIPALTGRSGGSTSKLPQSSSTKSESQSTASTSISKNTTAAPASSLISRPSSTPLIPAASRPTPSKVQKLPQLLRSVSAAGRLGIDPSPQSYRNAIIGKTTTRSSMNGPSDTSLIQSSMPFASTSFLPQPAGARKEQQTNFRPAFTFGSVNPDALPDHLERREGEDRLHQVGTTSSLSSGIDRQSNGGVADDFPHLDIINDLFDDEQCITGNVESSNGDPYYAHPHLHRQYSLGTFVDLSLLGKASGGYDHAEQYYDDWFHGVYPQMDLLAPYAFGQMDGGVAQIHWSPYGRADSYPYEFSYYMAANGYGGLYRQP